MFNCFFFTFKNLLYLIKNKELITQEYRTKVLFCPNTKVKINNLGRRKFDPMFHQSKLFSVCLEAGGAGSLGCHHTPGFCLDSRLPSSSRPSPGNFRASLELLCDSAKYSPFSLLNFIDVLCGASI